MTALALCASPAVPSDGVSLTLPEGHDIVEIKGMAMAPELRPGDLAIVDRQHTVASPPGMYMVDLGIGEQPMYVESLAGHKHVVRLWVVDERYRRFELAPADVKLRGRIVGVFRRT
jgi:SOS-response transcriptional repressor LexA